MGRIVVTGATGAIGRPLARALVARGDELVVLTRDPGRAAAGVPGAAAYRPWSERATAAELVPDVDGADAVVHLAGAPIFGRRVDRRTVEAATLGKVRSTAALAEAVGLAARPPRVLVSASSQGYYGFAPWDRTSISTEESLPGIDVWAQDNVRWEAATERAVAAGVRVVLLRTGVHLGPDSGPVAAQREQFERGWGTWVRPGRQAFNWIHTADAVGLVLLALDDERAHGALNLTAPHPATNREFAETFGRLLGRAPRFGLPGAALRLFLGAPAEIVVHSHPVLPRRAVDLGYGFRFPLLEPALQDLLGR